MKPPHGGPPEKVCGNCAHFLPHRDPNTGRPHPSKQGKCGWKPQIKWAMAYCQNGFSGRKQYPLVYPVGVWKNSVAKDCEQFTFNQKWPDLTPTEQTTILGISA